VIEKDGRLGRSERTSRAIASKNFKFQISNEKFKMRFPTVRFSFFICNLKFEISSSAAVVREPKERE
jgi:hypothetical protein